MRIYRGIDWAEAHHDVAVIDDSGRRLTRTRVTDDLHGFTAVCQLLADLTRSPGGASPRASSCLSTSRSRPAAGYWSRRYGRPGTASGRSTRRRSTATGTGAPRPEPSPTLATRWFWRTCCAPTHTHTASSPADSELAGAVGVLARTQHDLAQRRRSEALAVRSLLREFFPAALLAFPDLTTATAMLVLTAAPTPTAAAALAPDQLTALLREAGRGTLPEQAARLAAVFAAPHLKQPPAVEQAMGQALIALVAAAWDR